MSLRARSIPNMIQGVSQQAPQQRRDTQAEEQFDCINSPVDGALARPGFDLVAFLASEDFADAFCFDIYRGPTEHYIVVVLDGDLKIYDAADGTECTVNFPDGKTYLEVSGTPKDSFSRCTQNDFTFIANKEVQPAMRGDESAAEVQEGLIYFRAGNYEQDYQLAIMHDDPDDEPDLGVLRYGYKYHSPDNSTSGNAEYITTNGLAATFYRALTGGAATVIAGDDAQAGAQAADWTGVAGSIAGDTGGVGGSAVTKPGTTVLTTTLNFSAAINGSVVRLRNTEDEPFDMEADDGLNNTHMIVVKSSVKTFNDLPAKSFDGFKVRVKGESKRDEDDYYVEYVANPVHGGAQGAFWQETIGWEVPLGLDPDTMPFQLVNTAFQEFTFEQAPWGDRLVGDEDSNPAPSFVGRTIQDIFSYDKRLAIMTEGSCVFSKSRNSYVFFKDTVQTVLDTDPIDIDIDHPKWIALLRRAVHASDTLMLWAQKAQFRIHSHQETFKQDTVVNSVTAAYEFSEQAEPFPVGSSLYFASEPGPFAAIRDMVIFEGKVRGDVNVTGHVPRYIPSDVRWLTGSDTVNLMVVACDSEPTNLYCYNWLLSDQERLQSAWNTWRLPSDCTLLWVGTIKSSVIALIQRTDGVAIVSMDVTPQRTDDEGDYLTRADLRITEAELVSADYDDETDTTDLTLPYEVPEAEADSAKMLVVVRESNGQPRGTQLIVTAVSGAVVTVEGDASALSLYIGLQIRSERQESEFYLRSEDGTPALDRLQVNQFRVVHANTGYYRAEVTYLQGTSKEYVMEGRVFGEPTNVLDAVSLDNGILEVPIGAENDGYTLNLINDTFLPSAWQTSEYHYIPVTRVRGRSNV